MQEPLDLRFRPTATTQFSYRASLLLVHKDQLLVIPETSAPTTDYVLPGGAIKFGESAMAGAQRESREELGLTLTAPELIGISESFWQTDVAEHELAMIVRATVTTAEAATLATLPLAQYDLDPTRRPRWVPVAALAARLQPHGLLPLVTATTLQHVVNHG